MVQKKNNLSYFAGALFLAYIILSAARILFRVVFYHQPVQSVIPFFKSNAVYYILFMLFAVLLFLRLRNVALPILFGLKAVFNAVSCFIQLFGGAGLPRIYMVSSVLSLAADVLMILVLLALLTDAMPEAKRGFQSVWFLPGTIYLVGALVSQSILLGSISTALRYYVRHPAALLDLVVSLLICLLPGVAYLLTGLWASRSEKTVPPAPVYAASPYNQIPVYPAQTYGVSSSYAPPVSPVYANPAAPVQPSLRNAGLEALVQYQQQLQSGAITSAEYEAKRLEIMGKQA